MSTHPVTAMNPPGMKSLPEEAVTLKCAAAPPYRQLTIINMSMGTICPLPTRWLRLRKATAAIAGR